jgi:two-component system, LytTR family, sensor kinase
MPQHNVIPATASIVARADNTTDRLMYLNHPNPRPLDSGAIPKESGRTASAAGAMELWRSGKAWLVIIGIGCFFGILDATQLYLLRRGAMALGPLLWRMLSYWTTYAALVPMAFYVAHRFRLDGRIRATAVAAHVGAALCFVVLHLGVAAILSIVSYPNIDDAATGFLNSLRSFSAGNFLVYWFLVGSYYGIHYYHQMKARELQAAHLQAVLTESRLQALKAQLNPHFLFNTLNTIFVLAKKGEEAAVIQTLSRLSELLRVTLDESRAGNIPFGEELSFLDSYLEIQKTRFSDRLHVIYEISSEARDALVPSMILQPLVENAVKYGVSGQVGDAVIRIRASIEGEMLVLEVSDNGPGFASDRPMGIGLANTEARLRYLYGTAQNIRYRHSDDGGAIVTISLPLHVPTPEQNGDGSERPIEYLTADVPGRSSAASFSLR